jgi:hypothetical protein
MLTQCKSRPLTLKRSVRALKRPIRGTNAILRIRSVECSTRVERDSLDRMESQSKYLAKNRDRRCRLLDGIYPVRNLPARVPSPADI